MADFKIRVKKNIGKGGERVFGKVGTELLIDNGYLIDLEEDAWCNGTAGFQIIADINEYFSDADTFQTVFELVDEPC